MRCKSTLTLRPVDTGMKCNVGLLTVAIERNAHDTHLAVRERLRSATANAGKENETGVRLVIPDGNSNDAEVTGEVWYLGLQLSECYNHTSRLAINWWSSRLVTIQAPVKYTSDITQQFKTRSPLTWWSAYSIDREFEFYEFFFHS